MRFTKTLVLCSTSAAILAAASSPAWAQGAPQSAPPEITAQEGPGATQEAPQLAEDAVQGEEDPEADLEAVVVTGLRRSLQSSQQIKRNSDQIVDAIVAEDIGKLPDITASASLARVQGVQVSRGAGEAADVQVRGLPDISTTYNGREIFTSQGRSVAIQDFPAGGVAALEVYKSSTANLIEGGIGGQVNVRSRRPFDFTDREIAGSFNTVYLDQIDDTSINGNLLLSDRFDTTNGEVGLLINAAYVGIKFLDSTREQALVIDNGVEADGSPEFFFPDAMATFLGSGPRYRPSVNAAVQWRPNERFQLYGDFLYQGFRSSDDNRYMFVPLFGAGEFTNVVLEDDGRRARSLTASGHPRPDGYQAAVDAETDTIQIGGGVTYENGPLRVTGDIAYTDSTYDFLLSNVDYAFASSPVRDVSFNVGGDHGGPGFSFRNFDLTDPANFIFRGFFEEVIAETGDDVQVRADAEYELGRGFLDRLEVGVRYNDRTASRRRGTDYQFREPDRTPLADLPIDLHVGEGGFDNDDGVVPSTYVTPKRDSIRDNVNQLRAFVGRAQSAPAFDALQSYEASESSLAGYAQLRYEFDLGGVPIDGRIGLRAIRTEGTIEGTARVADADGVEFVPISRENEYTDYLPNISARADLGRGLQARIAYTETRTRPNFVDLNPSGSIDPPSQECLTDPNSENCFRTANTGNPDLRPLVSKNYDFSLEYYFSRTGSLTFAAFNRDVNGFISRNVVTVQDPEYGRLRVDRPENGGDGRLRGLELAFVSFLDFDVVPEWARAFGLQANYTYIDAEAELGPSQALSLPGMQPLRGVSEHSYNLVALYEREKFSARLAYNFRSEFVSNYLQEFEPYREPPTGGPTRPLMEDSRGVLDFSTTYTPIENITIAFDVVNITGEPVRRSRAFNDQGDTFARQIQFLERLYSLGVRFRF